MTFSIIDQMSGFAWIGCLVLANIFAGHLYLADSASVLKQNGSAIIQTKLPEENELPGEEPWLEDFETEHIQQEKVGADYEETMQADSPQQSIPIWKSSDGESINADQEDDDPVKCPPPLRHLPTFSCFVTACQSDKACSGTGMKCCYNGCRYTCLVPVQPPSYVDWVKQPQARLVSGMSWLVPGKEENQEVEWCSTSEIYEADEEPLLCPEGYICHIEDTGDMEHEIPNRGRCVPVSAGMENKLSLITTKESCTVNKRIFLNGLFFKFNGHSCKCSNGDVLCQVGKQKSKMATSK